MKTQDLPYQQVCANWSNRILILSLLGIAYFTLFPFQFSFVPTFDLHRSPFLLGVSTKLPQYSDFFLNVLLFVPFGIGLCAKVRKRGGSQWTSLLLSLILGATVSYVVELMQFYIPSRDSGWEDVISNTTGSVAGFFLFELCGGAVLEGMSKIEDIFGDWLSPRRVALLLAAYFSVSFGISAILQKETRLRDWDPQCLLFVGNDASGVHPWMGQVFLLQIWNRALPEETIHRMTGRKSGEDAGTGLLGSYDFASSPPYQDKRNFLPALVWTPEQPRFTNARVSELNARSWLGTRVPVENLTKEIEKSGQFTVHIVCAPAASEDVKGRIVSLSRSDDDVNFHLREEGDNLVFWFRNPLSKTRSVLAWTVPNAFEPGKVRDIFASYDGSDAFIYLDGNPVPETYHLGPGASFEHSFSFIQTGNLEGYVIVYETLIFLPAGLLIGLATELSFGQRIYCVLTIALGLVLPAVLLEILLAGVSGRKILFGNIALSLVFGVAGILLINADPRFKKTPFAS
jgi:VanZ family protein